MSGEIHLNIFETVKAVVSVKQAAERYGFRANRSGMVCCPFHEDRHPSLKLNRDYFYCFGCGATGDVIDFASRLYGLTAYKAALKLAADFGIDTGRPPPPSVTAELKRRKNAQALHDQERLCVSVLTDYLWLLRDWKERYAPQCPEEPVDDRFVEACHRLDYVEYLLDELIQADPPERADIVATLATNNKLGNLKQRIERLRKEDEHYELERKCVAAR